MSVHYKFKSALDFDTFTFDGLHISVSDLKKAIIQKKKLSKITACDLQITNAQSNEEYNDDAFMIPKNSALIIARIPLSQPNKRQLDERNDFQPPSRSVREETIGSDLTRMKGTEEDKIIAMMLQSSADYDPKSYQRTKGINQAGDTPSTYRCNKCKKPGHWIKNCPYSVEKEFTEVRRNTGIPKSLRSKELNLESNTNETIPFAKEKQEVPEELLCSLCNDIFVDAVMIPCCGSSFCDDCVRTSLLESENNECPDCKEKGSSPGSLIPNRFLRNSVNSYKNETGHKSVPLKTRTDLINNSDVDTNKTIEAVAQKTVPSVSPVIKSVPTDNANGDLDEKMIETATSGEQISQQVTTVENLNEPVADKLQDVESDYEDNITVTMPPLQRDIVDTEFLDKPYNARENRHAKIPQRDISPRRHVQPPVMKTEINQHNLIETPNPNWEPAENDRFRENRAPHPRLYNNAPYYKPHIAEPPSNAIGLFAPNNLQPHRMTGHDVYANQGPNQSTKVYQQQKLNLCQQPTQQPIMRPFYMDFHDNPHNPNMRYPPHFVHPPYQNANYGFPPVKNFLDSINQNPSPRLASVYEGVAAKVGSGIIDDPLEAFNRIMKEKEQNKERRTPEFRRSHSSDSQSRGRFRSSLYDQKGSRESSSKNLRERSSHVLEKKHDRHIKRSNRHRRLSPETFSRSRSWSKSPHKIRSRSPNPVNSSHIRSNAVGNKFAQLDRRANDISPRKRRRDMQHERSVQQRKQENNDYDCLEPPPPGFEEGGYQSSRGNRDSQNNAPNSYDKSAGGNKSSQQRPRNFVTKVQKLRSLTPTFKNLPYERHEPTIDETRQNMDSQKVKKITTKETTARAKPEKLAAVEEMQELRKVITYENDYVDENKLSKNAEIIKNASRTIEKIDELMNETCIEPATWMPVLTENATKEVSPKNEIKIKKLKERKKRKDKDKDKTERKKNKKGKKEKKTRDRVREKHKPSTELENAKKDISADYKNDEIVVEMNEKKASLESSKVEQAKGIKLMPSQDTANEEFLDKSETKAEGSKAANQFFTNKFNTKTRKYSENERRQSDNGRYDKVKNYKKSFDLDNRFSNYDEHKTKITMHKPELSRWELDDLKLPSSNEMAYDEKITNKKLDAVNDKRSNSAEQHHHHHHHLKRSADNSVPMSELEQHDSHNYKKRPKERDAAKNSTAHSDAKNCISYSPPANQSRASVKYRLESKIVNKTNSLGYKNSKISHRSNHSKERNSLQDNFLKNETHNLKLIKNLYGNERGSSVHKHSLNNADDRGGRATNIKYSAEPLKTYKETVASKSSKTFSNDVAPKQQSLEQKHKRKDDRRQSNEGMSLEKSARPSNGSATTMFNKCHSDHESSRSRKKKKPKYKKEKKRLRQPSSNESTRNDYVQQDSKGTKLAKQKSKNKF